MARHRPASDHWRVEERSIALHRAIVEKARRDPRLLDIAKANLRRLEALFLPGDAERVPAWVREWKEILESPNTEKIFAFLVSREERACRLRQSSPFSGILTPHERWTFYETFATGAHHPSGGEHHGRE